MALLPYDAMDLPRRDGVIVAHHHRLETHPYEVVWDGTAQRQMGRLLGQPEEPTRPPPPRVETPSHIMMVEEALSDTYWRTTRELAAITGLDGNAVHTALAGLLRAGKATYTMRTADGRHMGRRIVRVYRRLNADPEST